MTIYDHIIFGTAMLVLLVAMVALLLVALAMYKDR